MWLFWYLRSYIRHIKAVGTYFEGTGLGTQPKGEVQSDRPSCLEP